MLKTPIKLSLQQKANLFRQLCFLEKAGITYAEAFQTLAKQEKPPLQRYLLQLSQNLRKGQDLAKAGTKIGLFNRFENNLLSAVLTAGSPEKAYFLLAEYYETRALQFKKLKSKLYFPVAILTLAIFVAPLPKMILGKITLAGYLTETLGILMLLGFIILLFIKIPQIFKILKLEFAWQQILSVIPLFGDIYQRQNTQYFIENLALLLSSGVPILQALPYATETMPYQLQRKQFEKIKIAIEQGGSFSDALLPIKGTNTHLLKQLSQTGEAAGKLSDTLKHYAKYEAAELSDFYQKVFSWLPKIIYAMVALWMAYSLVTGAGSPSIQNIQQLTH